MAFLRRETPLRIDLGLHRFADALERLRQREGGADAVVVRGLDEEDRMAQLHCGLQHARPQRGRALPVHRRARELDRAAEAVGFRGGKQRGDAAEGAAHHADMLGHHIGMRKQHMEGRHHVVGLAIEPLDELSVILVRAKLRAHLHAPGLARRIAVALSVR